MTMNVAVAKMLVSKKYYLVLNDELYIRISRSRYYEVKKYIKEKKMSNEIKKH